MLLQRQHLYISHMQIESKMFINHRVAAILRGNVVRNLIVRCSDSK